jgi:hypothetical protein
MIQRCTNPNNPRWNDYGGRGITVCKQWRDSFVEFLKAMGECPVGMEIERRENNEGYEPNNCYWATIVQQARNKRSNRIYTVAGNTGCIAELCQLFQIHYTTVMRRLNHGWNPDRAFTLPPRFKVR